MHEGRSGWRPYHALPFWNGGVGRAKGTWARSGGFSLLVLTAFGIVLSVF